MLSLASIRQLEVENAIKDLEGHIIWLRMQERGYKLRAELGEKELELLKNHE